MDEEYLAQVQERLGHAQQRIGELEEQLRALAAEAHRAVGLRYPDAQRHALERLDREARRLLEALPERIPPMDDDDDD